MNKIEEKPVTLTAGGTAREGNAEENNSSFPDGAGLTFRHAFSRPGVDPFDDVEWDKRTAEITDDLGKAIFRQEDVDVPASWSELATKIAVSKYFYGDIEQGTDPHTGGRENSIRQLIHRVTRTITDWGSRTGVLRIRSRRRRFTATLRGFA